jgi:Protein of unknown function (DUF1553)/Protein of unknown function (DUF1549)
MRYPRIMAIGCAAVLLAAPHGGAAPEKEPAAKAPDAAAAKPDPLAAARDARELTAKIDRLIGARWAAAGVEPAPRADDATFLRRVYLDLAGRIPSVAEARAFLKDPAPDKRPRLVETLLAGNAYVNHFTNVWRGLMLPEADATIQFDVQKPVFELWLRKQLKENKGYDQIVRQLLTVPIGDGRRGFDPYGEETGASPVSFYYAKDMKPENLGAATARLFLGVKLDCAQCHDHPFAKWKREQFWETAAFFGGIDAETNMGFIQRVREIKDRRELTISGGKKVVPAVFLDGTEPQWKYDVGSRETLAEWMTSPKNPWFAKATANRVWAYFFGTGLVEPVDDLRDDNPASHPELLDELARQFAAHQFDLQFLIRAVTASRAYQSASAADKDKPDAPRLFARMALRGMTPEQIFDSLSMATGFRDKRPGRRVFYQDDSLRAEFLKQFATTDKRTEFQTSILQSLLLMNGKFTEQVTSPERSATLAAVADSPFLSADEKVETLYLAALARTPRSEERERFGRYVRTGGVRGDAKAALGDVFWVLLNSPEFILNH